MFKKTFLAFACSTVLVACGGGGGSSSNNTDNGNPVVPVSDLDKAKQLIDTTNSIVAYFDSFDSLQSQYQPTFDAVSDAGKDIDNAAGLVLTLATLAYNDAQGSNKTYNAAQLQTLLDNDDYIDYQLTDSTFAVTVNASSVTVSGSAKAKYWTNTIWDFKTNTLKDIFDEGAQVTVNAVKLEAPYTAVTDKYNFKIVAGGKILTKNDANKKDASLEFKSDSTAQAIYSTAALLENRGDSCPETAELKFSNVVLKTTNAEIELTELASKAKKVQFKDGNNVGTEIIPTELTLKGKAISGSESLNLDASIKLNNDLTKTIDITNGESAASFINADLVVKLSGNVKGGANAIKPFNIDLSAKRSDYQKGTANIKIAVDKNALNVDVKTENLVAEKPAVSAKVSHANGAFVDIANVDQFTSADIKVGNTKYGTINKVSRSVYSATFTDNTTKAIAP
ncbi:hypothetical protein [Acinetobacter proteolyticus]|uniref:Lipoprotein n=1 Tax=Acinetobacter proteolyticus TaxID=1776741 RepID=A0A2N0WIY4_9GAMM|nr:hypothetical protein [Acinetobacter proteolyticus]PKF36097.1 hypothetical protein CW311_02685 [Acinetobacter proteolyticus]